MTDGTGAWIMSNLPTGPYRLEVSLQGFRSYVQTGIVLQVGATPTINAVLAVGSLEETVSVEAATPIVDVRSAGISEVVDQERIVELPLQGRQVTDLIVLAGAALEMGRPNTKNFQGGVSISVAGGMLSGIAYVLDGAMHNDVSNDGGLPLPFPDALQEFRVATSGLSAENGMHAGASVNAVTKSGTNALHGNVFEFLRDHRFNATHPFAVRGPDGKRVDDGLRRNQYGGPLGGPLVRDRLFFFGGYQSTFTRVRPGVFLGTDPCTINGVFYSVCTSLGNLNNRRVLYGENPQEAGYISTLDRYDDLTTMDYRGVKESGQRRAAGGVSLNGNWTWGRCVGLPIARGAAGGSDRGGGGPYANPADLDYDRGHCDWDRTHLVNFTVGYQSPQFTGAVLRALASNWQVSGIVNARSGDWLTVATGVTAFNGIGGANRVNQVSDDVYGEKTLNSYLNRAAFAVPDPGRFGNHPRNSIKGPGFWKADLAVSRLFSWGAAQKVEVRVEAFNLFNTFNWGNPITTLNSGNFGRIQSMAGDPRILQFGIKYGF